MSTDDSRYACTPGDVERFKRMVSDPEYRTQLLKEDRAFFGDWELSAEEARELCRDC